MQTTWPPPFAVDSTLTNAPHRLRKAMTATVVVGAVVALVGLDRPPVSLGSAIVLVAVAVAIGVAVTLRGTAVVVLGGSTLLFAPWLALRHSPWLLLPDVIALAALWVLALSCRNGAGVLDSTRGYRRRLERAAVGALRAPQHARVGVRTGIGSGWQRSIRQIAAPAVAGSGVALIVTLVLASGDAIFASYLDIGDVLATATGRFLAALAAMSVVVAAGGAAVAAELRPPIPERRLTSARSAIVAAIPLVAVYVVYVAVQCSTLLLGADYVRDRTGLTFAEYARSGFFQLVAVGLVTLVGLALLRPIVSAADGRQRGVLSTLAATATLCTVAMVIAAIVKLDLYADVFGLTMLRLYTSVFAAWLGAVLVVAMGALLHARGDRLIAVIAATALLGVAAMNVANPERIVAEHNLTDTIESPEFDLAYLLGLSADASPALVDALDELDAVDRAAAIRHLCRQSPDVAGLAWNRAKAAEANALTTVCNPD